MKKLSVLSLAMAISLLLTVTSKAQEAKKPGAAHLKTKKCNDVVQEILESSTRFKQLTKNLFAAVKKNKGSGFGTMLDASPNPARDEANAQSDKYELSLHESYPDRTVNIAHFEFNPKTKLLYEVNEVDPDKPKPIAFNKKLLVEFSKACR